MEENDSDCKPSEVISSSRKVMKNILKCLYSIIQHVDGILSISDGSFIITSSSTIECKDGQSIDIEEYDFKQEFYLLEEPLQYLKSIKRNYYSLYLLCLQNDIFFECDLTFKKCDEYSNLDKTHNCPVLDYLSDNIMILNEHVQYIYSFFKDQKCLENSKNIRQKLYEIYTQVSSIPKSNFERPQHLNDYKESIKNFTANLSVLRTMVIRLKKNFQKLLSNPDCSDSFISEIDLKRKIEDTIDAPITKKAKISSNENSDHNFLIPDDATKNRKKKKLKENSSESDTGSIEKKEIWNDNEESRTVLLFSDTESMKNSKLSKKENNIQSNNLIIEKEDNVAVMPKKKHKIKLENHESEKISLSSDAESVKNKKSKQKSEGNNKKTVLENYNNHETFSIKTKKKEKLKSKLLDNDMEKHSSPEIVSTDVEIIEVSKKKKRKHKTFENDKEIREPMLQEIQLSDLEIIENGTIEISKTEKKKRKHKMSKANEEGKEPELEEKHLSDSDLIANETTGRSKIKKKKRKDKISEVGKEEKKSEPHIIQLSDSELIENGTIEGSKTKKKKEKISKVGKEEKKSEFQIIQLSDSELIEKGTIEESKTKKKKRKHKISEVNEEETKSILQEIQLFDSEISVTKKIEEWEKKESKHKTSEDKKEITTSLFQDVELIDLEIIENESDRKKKKKKHNKFESEETKSVLLSNGTGSAESEKKRHKRKENVCITVLESSDDKENHFDDSTKKKQKNSVTEETKSVILSSEIGSAEIKKKKHERKENGSITILESSDSKENHFDDSTKKKHKKSVTEETKSVLLFNGTGSAENEKKKHKRKENESITILENSDSKENHFDDSTKKKHKNSVTEETKSVIISNEIGSAESEKKKHKRKENGSITVIESSDNKENHFDDSSKKKRKKSVTEETKSVTLSNEIGSAESEKTKHKKKENSSITVLESSDNKENHFDDSTKKRKHKIRLENNISPQIFNSEKDSTGINESNKSKINYDADSTVLLFDDSGESHIKSQKNNSDLKSPEELNSNSLDNTQNILSTPEKTDRTRNYSENSIISLGDLFTTHLEVEENLVLPNLQENRKTDKCQENKTKNKNDIAEQFSNNIKKYESQKLKKKKEKIKPNHRIGDLAFENIAPDYLQEEFEEFIKENDLDEDEQYLYLQDLLQKAKIHNDEISEELFKKINDLCILIDWDIPPCHRIEKHLSNPPSAKELEAMRKCGLNEKRFNKEEANTIKKNWENFCEVHGLDKDPRPFLRLRHKRKNIMSYEARKKFVQYLGRGLPQRALHSIYRKFRTIYVEKKGGRFTEMEDYLILTYCEKTNSSSRFLDLSNILKRPRQSCERRFRHLTTRFTERLKWSVEKDTQLVKALMKAIGSKNVKDLQDADLQGPHFQKAENLLRITWRKIKKRWLHYVYVKLFATRELNTGIIQYELYEILKNSGETDWKNIDWGELTAYFENFTIDFLRLQVILMNSKVLPGTRMNFDDLDAFLKVCEDYIGECKKNDKVPFGNRIMKHYEMKDGVLIEVEYKKKQLL